MSRLTGKVAIVAGDSSGIGSATCARFVDEGGSVVVARSDAERGSRVEEVLGAAVTCIPLEVSSYESWENVVNETVARLGRVDILVNSAEILETGTIEEASLDQWRRIFATNLEGIFFGCRVAVRAMRAGGGGSIVNVSSIAGLRGDPERAAYVAAAGALRALTKEVAVYCARKGYGIRCNSVHAGAIAPAPRKRQWYYGAAAGRPLPMRPEEHRAATIGGGLGPEDIAGAITFLASDESSYVTGAEYVVDGGLTA